nr:MAG TPA: hypothetical protein [Caudoviricetes sp.]
MCPPNRTNRRAHRVHTGGDGSAEGVHNPEWLQVLGRVLCGHRWEGLSHG